MIFLPPPSQGRNLHFNFGTLREKSNEMLYLLFGGLYFFFLLLLSRNKADCLLRGRLNPLSPKAELVTRAIENVFALRPGERRSASRGSGIEWICLRAEELV